MFKDSSLFAYTFPHSPCVSLIPTVYWFGWKDARGSVCECLWYMDVCVCQPHYVQIYVGAHACACVCLMQYVCLDCSILNIYTTAGSNVQDTEVYCVKSDQFKTYFSFLHLLSEVWDFKSIKAKLQLDRLSETISSIYFIACGKFSECICVCARVCVFVHACESMCVM